MLERGKLDRGIVEMVDTESLVPQDHLLRKIDAAIDFNRLYEMMEYFSICVGKSPAVAGLFRKAEPAWIATRAF